MTITQSDTSLPIKSPSSGSRSLPLLDLYNIYTLAQEVLDDPEGRHVRRNAGQIVRECKSESEDAEAEEPTTIIAFAERIRAIGATAGDRAVAAAELLDYLDVLIDVQLAELGLTPAGELLPDLSIAAPAVSEPAEGEALTWNG